MQQEKVERALISLGKTELSKMIAEQEKSEVTCQFCDKIYSFSRDQLQELLTHATEKNKNKKISKKVLTFGACSDIINIVAERHKQNSDEVWPGSSVG